MNGLMMKYFVLNPTKNDAYGKASRSAIFAYSVVIADKNPELAKDLRDWIARIENPKSGRERVQG